MSQPNKRTLTWHLAFVGNIKNDTTAMKVWILFRAKIHEWRKMKTQSAADGRNNYVLICFWFKCIAIFFFYFLINMSHVVRSQVERISVSHLWCASLAQISTRYFVYPVSPLDLVHVKNYPTVPSPRMRVMSNRLIWCLIDKVSRYLTLIGLKLTCRSWG